MGYSVKTSQLGDSRIAQEFYEERYNDGYMDDWPQWKKLRVVNLIQQLNLPKQGKALDFGCGRGIFTQVIKEALPDWEVTGCDISATAMNDARKRFSNLRFFDIKDLINHQEKFDLVFSHHVLEHVFEINYALNEISQLQNPGSLMFHIMPCGNPGSFEHQFASKIPGGIDPANGNRFFFEDIGHVRRLTSDQMNSVVGQLNYRPQQAWFANQLFGSLEWMSDTPDSFLKDVLTNADLANGDNNALKALAELYSKVSRLKQARLFGKEGKKHRIKMRLLELKSKPWLLFRTIVNVFDDLKLVEEGLDFQNNLSKEWLIGQSDRIGSEMYLIYQKAETYNV